MSEINTDHLKLLEAILFSATDVMPEKSLVTRLPDDADLNSLLERLQKDYEGRGVRLVQAGKGWAFRTDPEISRQLNVESEDKRKLSRAAIETLAIVAYHQPVTRAEIEEVRGVSLSKGTLDVLFDAGWIKPKGRRRTPGRPMTWGTTDVFLDHFGLETVKDLPGMEELKAAGLIDTRPALAAYTARGDMGDLLDANAENEVAEAEAQEITDRLNEPLNPDDGVEAEV